MLLSLFAMGLLMHAAAGSARDAAAVVGATVIDVATGRRSENTTVSILDGRIVAVGASADLLPPADARLIDARGKWLIPGLVDMHTHVAKDGVPLEHYLAYGVTSIRVTGGSITRLRLMRESIEAGKTVGPRLSFCGPLLDGNPPVLKDAALMVDSIPRARSTVNFLADQGVDCIKVYNNVSAEVLREIVATAQQRNLPVIGHVPRAVTMAHAVALGLTQLEHIRVTARDVLPEAEAAQIDFMPLGSREAKVWERIDLASPQIKGLIQMLVDHDVVLDPTLAIDERLTVGSAEQDLAHARNRFLAKSVVEQWQGGWSAPHLRVPPELMALAAQGYEKRKRFVALCSRAGVRLVAGTDGPALGTLLPGFGLHHELQLLVEAGLTPLQALQAATVNAAHALGQQEHIGVIEPQAWADLVLLDADPTTDISNAMKIHAVLKNGRLFTAQEYLRVQ